jgi:hypothetical protein
MTAYKATAKSGYYSVNPPTISVTASDPTTHKAYVVAKTAPTALGQIQYKPGGACTGTQHTPGATSTKYLAIYLLLDDEKTSYCVDSRS